MVNHEGSSTVTLAVRDLSVKFGTRVILKSIIAKIEPGRITVLIGPNGAGKSTLLSGFAGHLADYSGLITIDETPIDNFTPKQLAALRAVMMQSCSFFLRRAQSRWTRAQPTAFFATSQGKGATESVTFPDFSRNRNV